MSENASENVQILPKAPHWWDAPAAAFDAWCAEHDPDGEMGLLDQIDAYAKWNDFNMPLIRTPTGAAP